jgi:multiple sugar transport system permease protein
MSDINAVVPRPSPIDRIRVSYGRWRRGSGIGPVGYAIRLIVLMTTAVFFGVPLIWLFITPTKSNLQLIELPPLVPGTLERAFEAFQNLMAYNNGIVQRWFWNSVWYVLTALVLNLLITIPAGYTLAIVNIKGRQMMLWLTLILMTIPSSALVLPMFMELHAFGLVNKPWGLILPSAFAPFGVYLTFVYYKTVMPRDVIDAARVDGCNDWQLFVHIGLPLASSLMGMLTFTRFRAMWNNFFMASIILFSDPLRTLPVGVGVLISGTQAIMPDNPWAQRTHIWRAEAALLGVITVLPVALVFLISQRLLVRSATSGALKGE